MNSVNDKKCFSLEIVAILTYVEIRNRIKVLQNWNMILPFNGKRNDPISSSIITFLTQRTLRKQICIELDEQLDDFCTCNSFNVLKSKNGARIFDAFIFWRFNILHLYYYDPVLSIDMWIFPMYISIYNNWIVSMFSSKDCI